MQLIRDKNVFRKYDYGECNPTHYNGSSSPPEYDLSKITTDLYLFYGDHDKFVAEEDLKILVEALPPEVVKGVFKIPIEGIQHNDLVYGIDAPTQIFEPIVDIFSETESH